jgi:hypothetical protein
MQQVLLLSLYGFVVFTASCRQTAPDEKAAVVMLSTDVIDANSTGHISPYDSIIHIFGSL